MKLKKYKFFDENPVIKKKTLIKNLSGMPKNNFLRHPRYSMHFLAQPSISHRKSQMQSSRKELHKSRQVQK